MECTKCSYHGFYQVSPISDHQIPEERNYKRKEGFLRCHDCGAITHKNAKALETTFYKMVGCKVDCKGVSSRNFLNSIFGSQRSSLYSKDIKTT